VVVVKGGNEGRREKEEVEKRGEGKRRLSRHHLRISSPSPLSPFSPLSDFSSWRKRR